MAKIVQVLTRPSETYKQSVADAQVRDLDGVIQKLNTTYQQELKDEVEAQILVSEDAGSGASITVTLVDASSNIFSLFKSKSISSNTTTELLTQPLVMEASEILKVQASDANELHVVASILEIEPREVTT
jgi:hypothetical protein